jgi:hypothetical protein
VLALGYQEPDFDRESAWNFRRWDWPEAVRLSRLAHNFTADLRALYPSPPDSMVVLYSLPYGTFFQTDDGPATREALRDETVRAYFINQTPELVPRDRLAILGVDLHRVKLVPYASSFAERRDMAGTLLLRDQPTVAYALASWGESADYLYMGSIYARAVARLLVQGPQGCLDELRRGDLADSSGARPAELTRREFQAQPGIEVAYREMLRHPLTAATHAALADTLTAHGIAISAGVELRVAAALDPSRFEERFKLAEVLIQTRNFDVARTDLLRIRREAPDTEFDRRARTMLARLPAAASAGT